MIPVKHPLTLTAIQLRRSVARMEQYIRQNPDRDHVQDGTAQKVLANLQEAWSSVPKELRD